LLDASDDAAELLETKHLEPLRRQGRAADEILTTVTAYLDHDRKVDDTARDLFVHRNTIRYRLTRFAEITGLDTDRTADMIVAWWLLNRSRARTTSTGPTENLTD
jgi:DNA-binding PucR family transcriptional regulator